MFIFHFFQQYKTNISSATLEVSAHKKSLKRKEETQENKMLRKSQNQVKAGQNISSVINCLYCSFNNFTVFPSDSELRQLKSIKFSLQQYYLLFNKRHPFVEML